MPTIPANVIDLAVRVFGNTPPQTEAEAKGAIARAQIPTADRALLEQHLTNLAALADAIRPSLKSAGTAGDSQRAAALGGKSARPVNTPFDFPSKAEGRALAEQLQKSISDGLGGRTTGIPNLAKAPEMWEQKDPQALKVWKNEPKMFEAAALGALFLTDGPSFSDNWLVDRAIEQNIDVSFWKRLLVQDGIVRPLSDEWVGLVEAASFFLDSGGWCDDDQLDAGRQILGQPNLEKWEWTSKLWDDTAREKMAALVQSSGGPHMFPGLSDEAARAKIFELLAKDPAEACRLIRERLGTAAPWLDDPAERRSFADALIVLKLADRSRGAAYACRGPDVLDKLRRSSYFQSEYVQTFRRCLGD